jgi:hypothetical protein
MYCPNCAAQVDGIKFCRQCGTNVSLVPQALTGQLPVAQPAPPVPEPAHGRRGRRRRHQQPPSLENAGREFFGGLGFLLLSLAIWQLFPGGKFWWFWMLIPAFMAMGKGIGQYFAVREQRQFPTLPYNEAVTLPPASPQPQFSVPTTSELKLPERAAGAPQSITEHTTRHLDAAPRPESERP